MIMNIKQRKIQIEPKTKLNYNIYILLYGKNPQTKVCIFPNNSEKVHIHYLKHVFFNQVVFTRAVKLLVAQQKSYLILLWPLAFISLTDVRHVILVIVQTYSRPFILNQLPLKAAIIILLQNLKSAYDCT